MTIKRRLPIVPDQDHRLARDLAWDHHHYGQDEPLDRKLARLTLIAAGVLLLAMWSILRNAPAVELDALSTRVAKGGKVRGEDGSDELMPCMRRRADSLAAWTKELPS